MNNGNIKCNGYGVLRFIFAMSVVYTHSFALSGSKDLDPMQRVTGLSCSHFGVMGFFILSGYLNAQSVSRGSAHRWRSLSFLLRRAFRIFPLLWAILLAIAAVYVAYAAAGGLTHLASNRDLPYGKTVWSAFVDAFRFSRGNAIPWLPHYSLAGVFEGNPSQAICGSLWTLPYEIVFYLILSMSQSLGDIGRKSGACLMFVTAVTCVIATTASPGKLPIFASFQTYWLGTLGFAFLTGLALAFQPMRTWLTLTSAGILFFYFKFGWIEYGAVARAFEILCFGVIIVHVGSISLGGFSRFSEKYDPSYWIYLLSFPIQQMLVSQGVHSVALLFWSTSAISILFASLTWCFIERPALRIGRNWTLRLWS